MSASVYYNEIDPYCCQWLQNLMDAGHLPYGWIDSRPIQEVHPDELEAFDQCHFFAGIGGWPLALQMADWGEEPVWTGSCPCQPFSVAGKRKGTDDERHLWPYFHKLIGECKPATVFGEQVASKDGRIWLAGVRTDLEALGYAVGVADLCAAGVGAPHIRQRLWWVSSRSGLAHSIREGLEGRSGIWGNMGGQPPATQRGGDAGRVAIPSCEQVGRAGQSRELSVEWVGDTQHPIWWPEQQTNGDAYGRDGLGRSGNLGFWSDFSLIPCLDGKQRRIEPGTFPLAHGVPARVGKLRAYGNAIVPQVAAEFVQAYLDCFSP